MQQKVSIATDRSSHFGMAGPAGLVNFSHMAPSPCAWEATVPMNHMEFMNGAIGKHSLAAKVLHRGQPIVQQFHDCGYLIVHLSPLGDPGVAPFQSSRVVVFGAGLVKVERTAVGFAIFGNPQTPMLTCGKVPLPVAASDDSPSNSVVVGLDPSWDHQCGWDHIGLLMFKGVVASAVSSVFSVAMAFLSPVKSVADIGIALLQEGLGIGVQLATQAARDSARSNDIGRRYQERMQRRRAAGEQDFESARTVETHRGGAEGVVDGAFGGVIEMLSGPASDYLFGTGPEEPER